MRSQIFCISEYGNRLPSNIAYKLAFPQLPSKRRESHLLPRILNSSLISIGNLFNAGFKAIIDEQTVNITRKGIIILKGWRYNQNGLWRLSLHNHLKKISTLILPKKPIICIRQHTCQTQLNTSTQKPSSQLHKIGQ